MKLTVSDFFCHKWRQVGLSDTGLVVVTGSNGAGKSALFVESIAFALFGKTTRGVTLAHPAKATVEIGNLKVERSRGKREVSVTWWLKGVTQATAEGATKAQGRINEYLGLDFESWHRTHVFSIEKVTRFTTAKDSERKELLEGLLGLGRFDDALKVVRADKAEIATRRRVRGSEIVAARKMLGVARSDASQARVDIMPHLIDDTDYLKGLLKKWEAAAVRAGNIVTTTSVAKDTAADAQKVAYGDMKAARARLDDLQARLAEIEDSSECVTCHRPFDTGDEHELVHDRTTQLIGGAEMVLNEKVLAYKTAQSALHAATAAWMASTNDHQGCIDAVAATKRSIADAEAQADAARQAEQRLAALEARVEEYEVALAVLDELEEEDGHDQDVIAGAELVLGLRGARARLLADGLAVLEANANHALSVMGSPGRVKLGTTSGKVDGTINDTISVALDPWGGGNGYDGASGGERKRVDLALLVAVSSLYAPPVAMGARLPLLFDDVFDTLDPLGVDAVAALLASLAVDRPVVIVTQNTALADRLVAGIRFDM